MTSGRATLASAFAVILGSSLAASGCYSPTFPEGVLCSVPERQCPGDQVCASDNRCYDSDPGLVGEAKLSSLETSSGLLEPPFDPNITSYSLKLGLNVSELRVVPTAAIGEATIRVSDEVVDSGMASTQPLLLGASTIDVVVEVGKDTSSYTLHVHRGANLAHQAYLKASNPTSFDFFGNSLATSGNTIVVGVPSQSGGSAGVGAVQATDGASGSGAVYIFSSSNGVWTQQVFIKANNPDDGDQFGTAVALDGNTLVVGAPREDSSSVGVSGDQTDDSAPDSGAAYVYVRNNQTWVLQEYLKASNSQAGDSFGASVAISDGSIVIGAPSEDSDATGVNGTSSNNDAAESGAAYVFKRSGDSWQQRAYLKASNTDAGDHFGTVVAISGIDLAVSAENERSSSRGINSDSNNDSIGAGAVYLYQGAGGIWTFTDYVKASNTDVNDRFGQSISLDGNSLAIGTRSEDSDALGINGGQTSNAAFGAGAVYLIRREGSSWAQEAYIKASNTNSGDLFGTSVAVAGNLLVVGASGEGSLSSGTNGNQDDNAVFNAGATYMLTFDGGSWQHTAYIKASNPDGSLESEQGDHFGDVLALSDTMLVVASPGESSDAIGIDGSQSNNNREQSGSIYVLE